MIGRAAAAAVFLLCAAAAIAHARPSARDLARADALLREGNAEYARKNYDQAIRAYQEAYDLTQAPGFLFNIAQVHRVAGNCSEAIAHYERYLAADPKTRLRRRVEAFIAEMWRCVEVRRKSEKKAEPPPEAAHPAPEPPPPPAPTPEPSAARAAAASLTAAAPPPREPSAWRWVGLAAAAGGAIATGAGIFIGLEARSEAGRTEDFVGEWTPEDEAREEAAERDARSATILIAAGTVAVVGGVTLYLLTRHPREAAVIVTPASRGAALSFTF